MAFVVTEHRFARYKQHLCMGCNRAIDEEDYSRTFEVTDDGYVNIYKFCRDCRKV